MAAADETRALDEGHPGQSPMVTRLPDGSLLVELDRQPRARIRDLKDGGGALAREVQAAVLAQREALGLAADVEIVPVVLLYRCGEPDYVVITS